MKIAALKLALAAAALVLVQPLAALAAPAYAGPRDGVPKGAPKAYGFWSFAVLDGGKISRSGQPLLSEFSWLKKRGWKSVVDLRRDGEYGEVGDDRKLKGWAALGFSYLALPMADGAAPTDAQGEAFLKFVSDPANQPVEVHCRGGYGRTGALIALYRYEKNGWTMDQAIAESRLFRGGIDAAQAKWLRRWEKAHPHSAE